jgi:hypothetical protein
MSFWEFFFLLLIYVPLVLIWGFSMADIFRRDDLRGGSKALWFATVLLLPVFGTLMYLVFRPAGATAEGRDAIDATNRAFVRHYAGQQSIAEELRLLAELHEGGRLTAEEYATAKAAAIAGSTERAEQAMTP